MAFQGAHSFILNGNINAIDNSRPGGESGANDMYYTLFNCTNTRAAEMKNLADAACLGASHQSGERFDAPKCHPETRKAVISDIMSWVHSRNPKERTMWLNGPAGAGKSSIAQTIAERCFNEKKLISSFFFSRTAATGTGRNDGTRLIPTIAYHLAVTISTTKESIVAELKRDPAILTYSMAVQMKNLVVDPLTHATAHFKLSGGDSHIPELVIIDGLDECYDPEAQSGIIRVISGALLAEPLIPLRFLITSRPEWEIRKAFKLPSIEGICLQLTLDERYSPSADIKVYLKSEFNAIKRTHTLAGELSQEHNWPSSHDIGILINRSSGQFIYASTVMKFISDDRQDPRDRLQAVIDVTTASTAGESPYVQLDALYNHILSTSASKAKSYQFICLILQALIHIKDETFQHSVRNLADLLGVKQAVLHLWLVDLHSIMFIPNSDSVHERIHFFHASFKDFLMDPSRSSEFFVHEERAHVMLGHYCLARIMDTKSQSPALVTDVQLYAHCNYFYHMERSKFDDEFLNELRRYNIEESLMSIMLSQLDRYMIAPILKSIFTFNFTEGTCDFAVPRSEKLKRICGFIITAIDEFLLTREINCAYSCIYAISDIVRVRKNPRCDCTILDCWLATILENPARGGAHFLGDERCQYLFRAVWQQMSDESLSGNTETGFRNVSVLQYLLKRIKPSTEFGMFAQKMFPSLKRFMGHDRIFLYVKVADLSLVKEIDEYLQSVGLIENSASCSLSD